MIDELKNFPELKSIFESLQRRFGDVIIDATFEKQELSIRIHKGSLLAILNVLKYECGFNSLNDIIGLDNLNFAADGKKRFSILYQLYKFPDALRIRIAIDLEEGEAADSIYSIYKSSDWAEREIYDLFGISFSGHPDLRRIYMPDDFDGYPLRKDFPLEGKS
jgi:NADH-quinone oxidoreductase subunit C